ncbi:MAG TPA: ribbon-helix-helix protein, CopG family [Acidobacteriaceae bacterium]
MRILVDVPDPDLELLEEVSRKRAISRAEFIRRAIAVSLTPYRQKMNHAAFGAWTQLSEDGLAYQEKIRDEW